jgi:hypothetical protein
VIKLQRRELPARRSCDIARDGLPSARVAFARSFPRRRIRRIDVVLRRKRSGPSHRDIYGHFRAEHLGGVVYDGSWVG